MHITATSPCQIKKQEAFELTYQNIVPFEVNTYSGAKSSRTEIKFVIFQEEML
jgi:hypothetical protein